MEYPKVLLISSADPLVTAGRVALDYYKAFLKMNIEIDFLTLFPVDGYPEIKYVYSKPPFWRNRLNRILYHLTGLNSPKSNYYFFYSFEQIPPVPVGRVLNRIGNHYDLVLILFWQGMLSFKTVRGLFNKLHCQIHFMGVDYSQMTGGCHFTGDCLRYQNGCGICPAVRSKKLMDFTYYNVRYREKTYNRIKPVVYGNTYMRDNFYKNSYLLKNARVEASYDIYDMDEFKPMDKKILRERYNIPLNKKFIIFFGCQNLDDSRKGICYLLDSLNLFWDRLDTIERKTIQLVVAGNQFHLIADKLLFDVISLGFVSMAQIPELYAMADAYLSPSINDAGPMMVNQALSCGTPVVAFEMGTALESIKKYPVGYCAKTRDANDFAKGIETIYRLPEDMKDQMSKDCRDYAINHFSYSSRVKNILRIYEKYVA